jgi:hypothetical protein
MYKKRKFDVSLHKSDFSVPFAGNFRHTLLTEVSYF